MANLYSNPQIMNSFRDAYFHAGEFELKSVSCGGKSFVLPFVNGSPLLKWPFIDFYESVENPGGISGQIGVSYLPKVAL